MILLLLATQAFGWQSHCYIDAEDRMCQDGYEKARYGWRTSLEHPPIDQPEHGLLFQQALIESGIPQTINNELSLGYGVSNTLLGDGFYSIDPVLSAPNKFHERVVTAAEMAQLPDHSYSLWDWTRGNEYCPPSPTIETQVCHNFKSHMGALNSNHFAPQSQYFYAHYHALAVGRAAECKALQEQLPSGVPRFQTPVLACEKQAMLLEAIGQHYLQDAWSAGHMWERWGGPESADFPSLPIAVLIGSYSGTWHGAKAVMDDVLGFAGDWDDPLCAPPPAGESIVYEDKTTGEYVDVIGDIFQSELETAPYATQRANLFGCSILGMREVYSATGQAHGALAAPSTSADLTRELLGEGCWGQRVTNQSLDLGARIHKGTHPNQSDISGPSYEIYLAAALQYFSPDEVDLGSVIGRLESDRFRRSAAQARTELALFAKLDPNGTQAATGGLSSLAGVAPNGRFVNGTLGDPNDPPASWVDPALPWTLDGGGEEAALVLAFSDAHAADLCAQRADEITTLPVWANSTESKEEESATLELCKQLARPLLKVGTPEAYQTDQEPLCHYVDPTSDFVYSMHEEPMSHEDALEDWCTNAPSILRNASFERATDDWTYTKDAERVATYAGVSAPQGDFMLKLKADPADGASYAIATQKVSGEAGTSGAPLLAGYYKLTFLRRTITHEDNHWHDLETCESYVNPWFVARIDGADGNQIVYESDPSDWCSAMVPFDGVHYAEPEFVEISVEFALTEDVDSAALTFQIGTSKPYRHIVLVDGARLEAY